MKDETSSKFAYIWDSNLWQAYCTNSNSICKTRRECTTPRGVLEKIYRVVNELEYKWQYYSGLLEIGDTNQYYNRDSDGDYEWFKQPGKVYSQHPGAPATYPKYSQFTKYVNLHLGRAYDVMTGKEYWELTGKGHVGSTYQKPKFSTVSAMEQREILDKMMRSGFETLVDAFAVVKNEHLFNVFNSTSGQVEEFNPGNAIHYSQSQCAIVLERVFSRIYKYLQFKSTTGETFQRHINIDSGYKYLTTESLKNSDHKLDIYYDFEKDESDHIEKHYLRYLKKLNYYLGGSAPDIGLTVHEKAVLGQFCEILSKETLDWLDKKWDLCPLLQHSSDQPGGLSPRKFMTGNFNRSVQDSTSDQEYSLCIDFTKNGYMDQSWDVRQSIVIPPGWHVEWDTDDRLRIYLDGIDGIDLSQLGFKSKPTYTYRYTDQEGNPQVIVSNYDIAGYTLTRSDSNLRFTSDQFVTAIDFGNNKNLVVYAAWNPEYILEFKSDNSHYGQNESAGYMAPMKLSESGGYAPACTFIPPGGTRKKFTYFNDDRWQDTSTYTSLDVYLYKLVNWSWNIGNSRYSVQVGDPIRVNSFNMDSAPVITMTAYWKRAYDIIKFNVYEDATYCEVCIDNTMNVLVYPDHAPVLSSSGGNKKQFYGWKVSEGDYLSGVDRNTTIICGERQFNQVVICDSENKIICDIGDVIVCGGSSEPMCADDVAGTYVVCKEDEIDYTTPVMAYLVEHKVKKFNVVFKYMDEHGVHAEKEELVNQNTHLPRFHIHNSYTV